MLYLHNNIPAWLSVHHTAMPDLIRLMHGSSTGVNRLIKTFRVHWGAKKLQHALSDVGSPSNTHPVDLNSENTKSVSPLPIPKTPNFKSPNQTVEFENASGISKRQLEKKIHEIAIKEPRPPSHKPQWYVHDSILLKYHIDLATITPLIPLASPQTKTVSERAKVVSPLTPCGAQGVTCGKGTKKGAKRKTDGIPTVKSMFQNLINTSPENVARCDPPKPKRIKLELHVGTLQPNPEKRALESTSTQVQSAAKRLCLDEQAVNAMGQSKTTSVIVIDSDHSNGGNSDTKENDHASVTEDDLRFSPVSALKDITTTSASK